MHEPAKQEHRTSKIPRGWCVPLLFFIFHPTSKIQNPKSLFPLVAGASRSCSSSDARRNRRSRMQPIGYQSRPTGPDRPYHPFGHVAFAPVSSSLPNRFREVTCHQVKAMNEIIRDCLELPSAQRLKLARILLDTSESDQNFSPGVEAAWNEEIAARMKAVLNGSAKSSPLAEVLARFEKLYPA